MTLNIKTQLAQKEELQVLLNQYKSNLSYEVVEYLTELLELKISVIKEMQFNIANNEFLEELSLYKQIAIYNIYYRALLIMKKVGIEPIIHDIKNLHVSLSTQIGEDCVPLFSFRTIKEDVEKKGTIDLYRVVFDEDIRAQALSEIKLHLQNLREEYGSLEIGLLIYYEDLVKNLESNKELSNEELRKIELTQYMQQLLIEDYGLTQDSFVDETKELLKNAKNEEEKYFLRCKIALENYTSPYAIKSLEKEIVLVKKLPNMEIRNITKYII